ncbi:hypothetical protein JCM9957A_39620 [Kineosporia succinea]
MPTITAIEMSMSRGRVLIDLRRCSALRAAAEPTTCASDAGDAEELPADGAVSDAAAGLSVLGVSVTSLWSRPECPNV